MTFSTLFKKLKKYWLHLLGFMAAVGTIVSFLELVPKAKEIMTEEFDLSGTWIVTDSITYSDYIPNRNKTVIFRLVLVQTPDNKIEGKGEKIYALGIRLLAPQKTEIEVVGKVNQDSVRLLIYEHGIRRNTSGEFRLRALNQNLIEGYFRSNAANSLGITRWVREGS